MRKRLMTPGAAFIENGHLNIRDQNGVIRWTSNPADSDANREANRGFDINRHRLHHIERLILHRYGGPVDTDDAPAYLSVAFNAIAMSRQLRGWSQSIGPLLTWAREWTPHADPAETLALAQKVTARPRKMTGRTVGKLVRLTRSEWEALDIKTIDPFDLPSERVAELKADRKRQRDKEAVTSARRKSGVRSMEEIQSNSIRAFCERNDLSERTFRYNARKGEANLLKWLAKKGITEKLPQGVATLEETSTLISRHGAATFQSSREPLSPKINSSPRRAAPKRPRRKPEPVKKETAMPSNVIDFAPILADPDRREKLARLFDVVANSFSAPKPQAASRAG